ncbi:MAG TPA: histidine phosphatase family protein [Acidimicrobiales bacterium]
MELLLIRHARPNRDDGSGGPADPGLSPVGRRQAEALADWLAGERIDAIYASPMRRAQETAAPLAERLGLKVTPEPDIAEYDAGAASYIPIEELKAAGDPRWMELPDDVPAFQARVVEAVERIVADHASGRVAMVCHGGVVNVYLSWVLKTAQELFFLPHYTSVSRVLASGDGRRSIDSINEVGHLKVADVPLVEL